MICARLWSFRRCPLVGKSCIGSLSPRTSRWYRRGPTGMKYMRQTPSAESPQLGSGKRPTFAQKSWRWLLVRAVGGAVRPYSTDRNLRRRLAQSSLSSACHRKDERRKALHPTSRAGVRVNLKFHCSRATSHQSRLSWIALS